MAPPIYELFIIRGDNNMRNKLLIIAATSVLATTAFTQSFATDGTFNISATLLREPIVLTVLNNLSFPETNAGTAQTVTVSPGASSAAKFSATGMPLQGVTGSVTQETVELTCTSGACTSSTGDAKKIEIDTFSFGGDMNSSGGANFDSNGTLNNLTIGAKEHIKASNLQGTYTGTATFRLVYS